MNHMIGVIPLVENGVGRPESEVIPVEGGKPFNADEG
jgi:hypothetical protein